MQKCRLEDCVLPYEIWDTAGQERFHPLAVGSAYLSLRHAAVNAH